ncbi:BsuPI-related putative proteinase inhibitor [Halarsenatibacter silvermanii]|uniref:Intracellular proteinase inhibitor n=1 Tax=Halarsenatibacter silvermanii TaxID=321763 RepID=A0A1G9M164_9FIRM|nr:BsuPI-related putative proteinase inhibitor [Halarsenatibacter silvermanii]SDL67465.1 Intracellular proteinase inhibitor [Halarsenatibacter silvermanii]
MKRLTAVGLTMAVMFLVFAVVSVLLSGGSAESVQANGFQIEEKEELPEEQILNLPIVEEIEDIEDIEDLEDPGILLSELADHFDWDYELAEDQVIVEESKQFARPADADADDDISDDIPLDAGLVRTLVQELEGIKPLFVAWLDADKTSAESGDEVEVEMKVWNISEEEQTLNFRDGQVYDLLLLREGGDDEDEIKWRWSEGRGFTMALHSKTFEPGEIRSWQESFEIDEALETGIYQLEGWITAEERIEFNPVPIEISGRED